ncbi:1,4-beta-xylanase [candidate division KSB1 bacterium]|nr:MAG: 1,4-beta-xylanase [candidate division KSB1 bacterium]
MKAQTLLQAASFLPIIAMFMFATSHAQNETPALKEVFKKAFHVGAALNREQISRTEANTIKLVEKQFNSITAENIMKWERIHPEPERYDFAPVDSFVAFGEKNKMFIVGHTLIWHNQTPRWVFEDGAGKPADRETLVQRMKDHIFTVMGRYKGRIHGWDVINEAVEDDGSLRQSKYLQIAGEDYLQKAFEWARAADPQAELYYNDYNMWHKGKRETVIRLVRELQAKGVRVDGIGMQGHWGLDYPPLDELEESILAYAELGVKVMITEMDVNVLPDPGGHTGAEITRNYALRKELDPYTEGVPKAVQAKQAKQYGDFFRVLYNHRDKITRVTFWGVHDGVSWHNNWPVPGRTAHSLLFDRNLQPKPAFDAVIQTVRGD